MLDGIIMAAGYARRMGTNKLLLPFRGKSILEHTMDTVLQCGFRQIILVGREADVLSLGEKKGIKTVRNDFAHLGQSQSIRLGLQQSLDSEGYMFFAGDQPFLDVETIVEMIERFQLNPQSIVLPRYKEQKGSPVIFPRRFRQGLMALEGDTGGREIIKNHPECIQYMDIHNPRFLWDIDTLEDYKKISGCREE